MMNKQFDQTMEEYKSALTDGRIVSLELLLKSMATHKVTEVYQVEEIIDILLKSAKGDRYAAEASADHITSRGE